MRLNEYQQEAKAVSNHGTLDDGFLGYFALALAGEAGEFANLTKKAWRARRLYRVGTDALTAEERNAMVDELGDILWYLAGSAYLLGFDLNTVAARNLEKLRERNRQKGEA